jgi:uncharacterized protein
MSFEWDDEKSQRTLAERGIDFASIVKIWNDDDAIEITARSDTEPRWAKIGKLEDLIYMAIFTRRNSRIRIISARRARPNEEMIYGQK